MANQMQVLYISGDEWAPRGWDPGQKWEMEGYWRWLRNLRTWHLLDLNISRSQVTRLPPPQMQLQKQALLLPSYLQMTDWMGSLEQSVHFCFDRIPSRWNPPGWVGIGKERPPNTNFLNSRIILEESLCSALGLFSVTPLSWNPRNAKVKDKRHYFFKHAPLISQSHVLYSCCPFKVKCLLTPNLHVSKRQLPEARLPSYGSLHLRQLIALTLSQHHSTIFIFIW